MIEHPIIFSTSMVRAIFKGSKTQTRRLVSQRHLVRMERDTLKFGKADYDICPYGKPGDHMWVRETWARLVESHRPPEFVYKADSQDPDGERCRQDYIAAGYPYAWRSPIYMPREASRITLEVVKVRVELLQHISDTDAIAEGFAERHANGWVEKPTALFAQYWDALNAGRAFGWATNPEVWVIEFKRIV